MFHEEALHAAAQVRQLGVTVSEKNHAEREAERQQRKGLESVEGFHQRTSGRDFARDFFGSCGILTEKHRAHGHLRRQRPFQVQSLAIGEKTGSVCAKERPSLWSMAAATLPG